MSDDEDRGDDRGGLVFSLGLDPHGVVTSAAHSNAPQLGTTAVPADVFAAAWSLGVGHCTVTAGAATADGAPTWTVAPYAPPAPPPPPRRATLAALFDPLSPAQRAAITADHLMRLQADAAAMPDGTVFVGSSKVARAAADLGLTPGAWFTLAGV